LTLEWKDIWGKATGRKGWCLPGPERKSIREESGLSKRLYAEATSNSKIREKKDMAKKGGSNQVCLGSNRFNG